MKLQPSSTRWFLSGLLVGAALLSLGFLFGANFLADGFFGTRMHEWLAVIGTVGALVTMAFTGAREAIWRKVDASAAGRVAWGLVAYESFRLSQIFGKVRDELKSFSDPAVSNALTFHPTMVALLREASDSVAAVDSRGDCLFKLPPVIASNLGALLGLYPQWTRDVGPVLALGGLGAEEMARVLKRARAITDSMIDKCQAVVDEAVLPESEQWRLD